VREVNGPANTKGQVTQQDPIAETQVQVNSAVTITVNRGPETGTIPDGLVGKDRKSAESSLNDAGFDSVDAKAASSEPNDAEAGQVLSVSPKEGSTVALSSKVTLTYATGESTVPNLVGVTRDRAEADAKSAGFKVRFTEDETDKQPPGLVMSQDPNAGSKLARGETISVVVAVAPKPTPTPKPTPPPPTTAPPTVSTTPTPTPTPS
jgi:eukaryotic-like serine/threonine-protein kinase